MQISLSTTLDAGKELFETRGSYSEAEGAARLTAKLHGGDWKTYYGFFTDALAVQIARDNDAEMEQRQAEYDEAHPEPLDAYGHTPYPFEGQYPELNGYGA